MLWYRVISSRHFVRLPHRPQARFAKDLASALWSTTYHAHPGKNGFGQLMFRWCLEYPKFTLSECWAAVAWKLYVRKDHSCWSVFRGSLSCRTFQYSHIGWHSLVSNHQGTSFAGCWSQLICSLNLSSLVRRRQWMILVQEHREWTILHR